MTKMQQVTLDKPVTVDKKMAKPRSLKRVVMPRTEAEWCAYRCQLSCKIGRDALEGKTQPPAGCSPLEYAVFNLLHAVEELAA